MIKTKSKEGNIFLMSLPIFVELFMQFLVGNIDQWMLSSISDSAVASIVNANQIISLTMVVMVFFSNAGLVRFTHAVGRKDEEMFDKTFFASHFFMFIYAMIVMVVLICFSKNFLMFFKIDSSILTDSYQYIVVVVFAAIPQGIYFVNAAALRAKGKLKDVMYISIAINILNICGNAILINGWFGAPALGVLGAAISTAFSKMVGCAIVTMRLRGMKITSFKKKYFANFPRTTTRRLLKMAIPSSMESLSYSMTQLVTLGFINAMGTYVVATRGYCGILANFAYLYSIALSQSTQIIIGYFMGGGQFGKIKSTVIQSTMVCIVCSMMLTAVLYVFSDRIFDIFNATAEIKALGKAYLAVEFFLEFGRSVNIMMARVLTSLGDNVFLMCVGISSQWIVATAGGYLIGVYLGFGLVGLVVAMAIDEILRGIIFLIRFGIKKWNEESIIGSKRKQEIAE